jgi:hypothetical protein
MWGGIPTLHGPCSYCYSPYHHVKDCPTAVQFSSYSYEHMNTLFSRSRNDPYCDSYDLGWSNQSNISWQAQAPENYAPQFHELYHHAKPPPPMNFDFQDQMMKFISKMDQIIDSQNQMVNFHSKSITEIEALEEEPSPIYWLTQ